MLALAYDPYPAAAMDDEKIASPKYQFGLVFDGDYIDMYPLFKFCGTSNPAGFIKGSEYRAKYAATVQTDLGHDPAFRIDSRPKRMFYHKQMVKMILYTLGLLELEEPIASCWDMDELPMPENYQFDFWDMPLTLYDHSGTPRKPSIVRVFQLRATGWVNLTPCTIRYDGDDVTAKRPYDIAKNNTILFRQLWALTHLPTEVVTQDALLNLKTQPGADAKKALASQFVDTSRCYGETWCHPVVFNETMMTLSLDYRMKATSLMLMNPLENAQAAPCPTPNRREILTPNVFCSVEFIPGANIDRCGVVNLGDLVSVRLVREQVEVRKIMTATADVTD